MSGLCTSSLTGIFLDIFLPTCSLLWIALSLALWHCESEWWDREARIYPGPVLTSGLAWNTALHNNELEAELWIVNIKVLQWLIIFIIRFLGVVGHHEDSFPVEKLDVNTTGELVASISHDNRWGTVGIEYRHHAKTRPGLNLAPWTMQLWSAGVHLALLAIKELL